jgi:hypothetical protein
MLPELSMMNRMFGCAVELKLLPMNSSVSSAIAGIPAASAHKAPRPSQPMRVFLKFMSMSLGLRCAVLALAIRV